MNRILINLDDQTITPTVNGVSQQPLPYTALPSSVPAIADQLATLVDMALDPAETRYHVTVVDDAVTGVAVFVGPISIGQPMTAVTLANRTVVGVSGVHTLLAPEGECIATCKPTQLSQLLAGAGINASMLDAALPQLSADAAGPTHLVVVRLDEAALLLAQAGFDVSLLVQHIAQTGWQSPGRPGPAEFGQAFISLLPDWIDKWRR